MYIFLVFSKTHDLNISVEKPKITALISSNIRMRDLILVIGNNV